MHVTDWAATQKEDPKLDVVLPQSECLVAEWVEGMEVLFPMESKKKTDLRILLREYVSSKEGWMVWRNHQNFTTLSGTLYLCSTPKGENEDLLLFMVPKMHQVATLNGCHRDAGHQGCDCTLSLCTRVLLVARNG